MRSNLSSAIALVPTHSIQLLCSAFQQLTDLVRVFLHHLRHGVEKRANAVAKASHRLCFVLLRPFRVARREIKREDPRPEGGDRR